MPGSCNLANIMLCTDLILAILPLLLYLSHLSHAMILEVIQSTHTQQIHTKSVLSCRQHLRRRQPPLAAMGPAGCAHLNGFYLDVSNSSSSAFSDGESDQPSRTTMLIKALRNNRLRSREWLDASASVCVCPEKVTAKKQLSHLRCHYTDGQKHVVSVP